jgi:hypothetical protein
MIDLDTLTSAGLALRCRERICRNFPSVAAAMFGAHGQVEYIIGAAVRDGMAAMRERAARKADALGATETAAAIRRLS